MVVKFFNGSIFLWNLILNCKLRWWLFCFELLSFLHFSLSLHLNCKQIHVCFPMKGLQIGRHFFGVGLLEWMQHTYKLMRCNAMWRHKRNKLTILWTTIGSVNVHSIPEATTVSVTLVTKEKPTKSQSVSIQTWFYVVTCLNVCIGSRCRV